VADRARELLQRLVQLSRRRDERVVAKRRDRRRGPRSGLIGIERALDLVTEANEGEPAGDDLLRERLAAPLVFDLHQLVRGGKGVVARRDHLADVVWRGREPQAVLDVPLVLAQLDGEVPDRVPELVGHLLVDDRLVERREVLPLQVLDERDLERRRVVESLDDRGDRLLARELRSPPPPLA